MSGLAAGAPHQLLWRRRRRADTLTLAGFWSPPPAGQVGARGEAAVGCPAAWSVATSSPHIPLAPPGPHLPGRVLWSRVVHRRRELHPALRVAHLHPCGSAGCTSVLHSRSSTDTDGSRPRGCHLPNCFGVPRGDRIAVLARDRFQSPHRRIASLVQRYCAAVKKKERSWGVASGVSGKNVGAVLVAPAPVRRTRRLANATRSVPTSYVSVSVGQT